MVSEEQLMEQTGIIDAETGFNLLMVKRMAESIRVAHELNPRSWQVHTTKDQTPFVGVGSVNVGTLGIGGASQLIIDSSSLDDAQRVLVEKWDMGRNYTDPETISLKVLKFPNPETEEILRSLDTVHELAVKTLSKWDSPRRSKHRQDIVDTMGELLGDELPEPSYPAMQPSPPPNSTAGRRYWKISPGLGGALWGAFKSGEYMAMKFFESPVEIADFPEGRTEFLAAAKSSDIKLVGGTLERLWQFARKMHKGDKVVAYASGKVLGYGTVIGELETVIDEVEHRQRRTVAWEPVESQLLPTPKMPQVTIDKFFAIFPLGELTQGEYALATGGGDNPPPPPLDTIQLHFAASGLAYSKFQIATFYTSLQSKGFVVLSGISGTGKSKIAQGFVELLPGLAQTNLTLNPLDQDYLTVTLGKAAKGGVASILPKRQVDLILPEMEEGETQIVPIVFGNIHGSARLKRVRHYQGNLQTVLRYGLDLKTTIKKQPTGTKLFILPILSGSEDKLERIEVYLKPPIDPGPTPVVVTLSNHLFLSVRPDWRDSTSLLGYFNPLTQEYQWTDFLRFVILAAENFKSDNPIAWFVILDEMNLAHVEYYFADLLSVIESGRGDDGFTKEPLRISFPEIPEDDEFPPTEVRLPPNLYIIGTVNMDETTHAFSPKVLDRAFTIELTEVDFADYPPATSDTKHEIPGAEKQALLSSFSRNGKFAVVDKRDISKIVDAHPEIRDWLQSLNNLLRQDRFHFGYRVFDEIAQYLFNNDLNKMMDFEDAFDQAVFMKVLPKFSGSRARLKSPLLSVLAWTLDPDAPMKFALVKEFEIAMSKHDGGAVELISEPRFPRVYDRVLQMLVAVETDGFVSFG